MSSYELIIIGGGQAGLSAGYYAERGKLNYLIIDDNASPGGAWNHTWDSLQLFSPGLYNSLPGWIMPKTKDEFPHRDEVIDYLTKYEERYKLKINRPERVISLSKDKSNNLFQVTTNKSLYYSKTVILSTGTWSNRNQPTLEGIKNFEGEIIHSSDYKSYKNYIGKNVLVVGAGNSGAQIAAELSKHTDTVWATKDEPVFLPEDITGKDLFDYATKRYKQQNSNNNYNNSLGNIVQVEDVKDARKKNIYNISRMPETFTEEGATWEDGIERKFDIVIMCTGFRPAIDLMKGLGIDITKRIKTKGTKVENAEGLWAVGLGNWTGFASATLIGVGRTSKRTISEIKEYISNF